MRRSPRIALTATALILCTSLAACNGGGGGGSTSIPDNLVVLNPVVAPGLDPDGPNSADPSAIEANGNLYGKLVSWGTKPVEDGVAAPDYDSIVPELAESWSQIDDKTWEFKLRKGVKSCDGNEFTSADVVYTYERAISVADTVPVTWFVANVAGILPTAPILPDATDEDKKLHGEIEAVDDYTVRFHLDRQTSLFPGILTNDFSMIFDSKTMKANATPDDPWAHDYSQTHGAGFGPYCASEFKAGESLNLKANEGYYEQPEFKQVTVKAVPSNANRVTALRSGEAQIVTGLTPSELKSVSDTKTTETIGYYGQQSLIMQLSFSFPPFSLEQNAKIRQAIAYAIPYDDIIKNTYLGNAKRMYSPFPADNIGAAEIKTYDTDIDKAKELLAEAGFPDGKGLEQYADNLQLYFATEVGPTVQPAALAIQDALKQIGINIELSPINQATLFPRLQTKNDIPMDLDPFQVPIYPDAAYATQLDFATAANGGVNNNTLYDNPAVQDLLTQSITTPLGPERDALLEQIQQTLMTDLPWIPIVQTESQIGIAKGLTNWAGQPIGLHYSSFKRAG
jgi:peptide/nickel transport system substrate-binding protein